MYPSRSIEIRDWELELTAFPLEPEHRGPLKHLIGVGPVMVGNVNDTEKLRATLNRKRGKYGALREPLLLAVLMPSTFADLPAVEKALFGDTALQYYMGERGREQWFRQHNGFWIDKRGPRAQSVSGLITGFGILPGPELADRRPRLWPNPWATNPLKDRGRSPSASAAPRHSSNTSPTRKRPHRENCSDFALTGPVPSHRSSTTPTDTNATGFADAKPAFALDMNVAFDSATSPARHCQIACARHHLPVVGSAFAGLRPGHDRR